MMGGVYLKLSVGLPWQKTIQQEENCFHQHIGIKFKEETSSVLLLELAVASYGAETWTLSKVDQKYV